MPASIASLNNQKCLVTGAASGIGRATAIAAARDGAVLFLTDVNAAALAQVASEIRDEGGNVAAAEAFDIADLAAVRRFGEAIHARHGSLDVVMNIAGISVWGTVDRLEHQHWQRCVDINLMGPIHVIETFIPPMIAAGRGGRLVNVSSAAGLFGLPWHAPYSAAKFGLRGVSEVLRFDLARHGIGVSLVCPGGVDTGLVKTIEVVGVDTDNPQMEKMRKRFQSRAITPEQAAHAILRGIYRNRYLVYTSADIRVGHWLQRWCPPLYALVMRRLNNTLHKAANLQPHHQPRA
ncbi:SDR family oxidoreductase [Sinimarinibacterium sp. NLF-5-8]|uniref:SDR family oxidoreductase n=1 Tax=Sinimarinibacterium sp. NLF-5-8 TaxID=2698684 RepID=UPI00137C1B5B|nr:SDR family oxidoreductase [Sinimarinibacterium sp. NLF-5-8]QHS10565.1 SDR family oxidoreductase [Sinimarinibacterium sp. NLF-5-8]